MVKTVDILGEKIKVISYNSYNDSKGHCFKVMNDCTGNYLGCIEGISEGSAERDSRYIIDKVTPLIKSLKDNDEFI